MRGVEPTHQPKVLIIGLDGATLDLITPWAETGKLPTFKRLLDEGMHGELQSTFPPVTAPAWTSFMTGKNPGKHGLYDFIEPQPGSYELRYANARSRLAKTVWQLLSEAGVSVGVLNVPMTYPPEPVYGYMLSGLDAPDHSTATTFPPELYQELKEKFGKVSQQVRYLGYLKTDERRAALLRSLEEMNDHYLALTQYLMQRHPVDVVMVVLTALDTVQHFFWQYMDAAHPQHDPTGAMKYAEAILRVYQKMDDIIGQLMADLPDETAVIVMSDHGAVPTSAREIYLNRYLVGLGLLHLRQASQTWYHPRALWHAVVARIDSVLRGTLTPQQKESIAALLPRLRKTWEAHATRLSHIDWQKTKAYSHEILTHPAGIWINLKGLRPQGIVQPGAEYEQVVQCITEKLYELRDPVTGQQLIHRIYRKEEIYTGPYLDRAPDLTLVWWDGVTFIGKNSFAKTPHQSVVRYVGGQSIVGAEWGGSHALAGMVAFWGKAFQTGKKLAGAQIVDLAPTLLYLLGLPIPEDMDGRVLREACTDTFAAAHAVVSWQATDKVPERAPRESTYAAAEANEMMERLRNLGYIE